MSCTESARAENNKAEGRTEGKSTGKALEAKTGSEGIAGRGMLVDRARRGTLAASDIEDTAEEHKNDMAAGTAGDNSGNRQAATTQMNPDKTKGGLGAGSEAGPVCGESKVRDEHPSGSQPPHVRVGDLNARASWRRQPRPDGAA